MVNLNVRLDESEHQRLKDACEGRNCGKSEIVRAALKSYLNAQSLRAISSTTTNQASQSNSPTEIWYGIPKAKIRGVVE